MCLESVERDRCRLNGGYGCRCRWRSRPLRPRSQNHRTRHRCCRLAAAPPP